VFYDLTTEDFQLTQTNDLTLRGQYEVSLTATVEVPDGQDPETIQTYSASITYTVTINPCPINDYTVSPTTIEPIEYILGGSGFNFGAYLFTQDQACGYI
jgi:hypothetical protein